MRSNVQKQIDSQAKQQRSRVVETSAYPVLNADLLKRKGKKVFIAEGILYDEPFKIGVRRGVPIEFQLMMRNSPDVFGLRKKPEKTDEKDGEPPEKPQQTDDEAREISEQNRKFHQIFVASLVVQIDAETEEPLIDDDTGQYIPFFAVNGIGGDVPIEEQSDDVLEMLYELAREVQAPSALAAILNDFRGGSGGRGRSGKNNSP